MIGTLIGAFITASGILLSADTSVSDPTTGKTLTVQRKLEVTGRLSGAAINGQFQWSGDVSANFLRVFREVSKNLRTSTRVSVGSGFDNSVEYRRATSEYGGKYGSITRRRARNFVAASPRNFGGRSVISWRRHEIRRARLGGAIRIFACIRRSLPDIGRTRFDVMSGPWLVLP